MVNEVCAEPRVAAAHGADGLPGLACVARTEATVEHRGRTTRECRHHISSRPLDAKACADAVQSRRKAAGWSTRYPLKALQCAAR